MDCGGGGQCAARSDALYRREAGGQDEEFDAADAKFAKFDAVTVEATKTKTREAPERLQAKAIDGGAGADIVAPTFWGPAP